MASYHLRIVTPDRLLFDGEAKSLIVRTTEGEMCVMANHIDFAAPLAIGTAKVEDADGTIREAACNSGILTVSNNNVEVAAVTFEWSDEIDVTRAEKAREAAEQRLQNQKLEKHEYALAEAKLKRALTRLHVTGK